jgi:hypothetical protein
MKTVIHVPQGCGERYHSVTCAECGAQEDMDEGELGPLSV